MSGFQEGNELDARAWPTAPAPEVDFFPPPPPPLPEPPLQGVYTDPNLQFRAGVMLGTDTVQAMTAMNGVLQREAWAADEARRQAELANTSTPSGAGPTSLPPRSAPRPMPAPAPAAPPHPQAYDLCCQSTRQGLQALQEQLQERRDERRQGARRTARHRNISANCTSPVNASSASGQEWLSPISSILFSFAPAALLP